MSVEKTCENCACGYMCKKYENISGSTFCYELNCLEKLVREDEKHKFITLLKSDLENFEGLAIEDMKNNNINNLIGNNAVIRYIEETIEVLKEE